MLITISFVFADARRAWLHASDNEHGIHSRARSNIPTSSRPHSRMKNTSIYHRFLVPNTKLDYCALHQPNGPQIWIANSITSQTSLKTRTGYLNRFLRQHQIGVEMTDRQIRFWLEKTIWTCSRIPPEMITRSIFYKIVTNDEIVKCNWEDIATRCWEASRHFFSGLYYFLVGEGALGLNFMITDEQLSVIDTMTVMQQSSCWEDSDPKFVKRFNVQNVHIVS